MRWLLIVFLLLVIKSKLSYGDTVGYHRRNIFRSLFSDIEGSLRTWTRYFLRGPVFFKTTADIIRYQGYEVETHTVVTNDGYVIDIHRIPSGKNGNNNPFKTPVILQHGFLASSAYWVLNQPSESLGYLLADANYDVWLGNIRGNQYGRGHEFLNPDQSTFWEFSWDEMAKYDMPAIIDYVLKITGQKQLYYIGHSTGGAIGFSMLSSLEQYNEKIKAMFGLAPVGNLTHVKSLSTQLLAQFENIQKKLFELLGIYEIDIYKEISRRSLGLIPKSVAVLIADIAVLTMVGVNCAKINVTNFSLIASHVVSSTSLYTMGQLLQTVKTNQFKHYNWGENINIIKYGQPIPPDYNVGNIQTPVALFSVQNDNVISQDNIDILAAHIPNLIGNFKIGDKYSNHVDFLFAADAGTVFHEQILTLIRALEHRVM